jgi:hypothetical protein
MMIEEKLARLRTHRNNIRRYSRLLKTQLTDFERQFIEKRLSEERSAMQSMVDAPFPLVFRMPMPGVYQTPIAEAGT